MTLQTYEQLRVESLGAFLANIMDSKQRTINKHTERDKHPEKLYRSLPSLEIMSLAGDINTNSLKFHEQNTLDSKVSHLDKPMFYVLLNFFEQ